MIPEVLSPLNVSNITIGLLEGQNRQQTWTNLKAFCIKPFQVIGSPVQCVCQVKWPQYTWTLLTWEPTCHKLAGVMPLWAVFKFKEDIK